MSVKKVGMMCVKDEADLLPLVYPHIINLVDYLYVYDDFSQDNTWELVKHADYAIRAVDDAGRLDIPRPNYHHLLEKIREDFKGEDVWVFITMGDRFFLNKTPSQIVENANNCDAVWGVQVDFIRPHWDPWTIDNVDDDIKTVCTYPVPSECCVVAYKLQPHISYLQARYPWPKGLGKIQYKEEGLHKNLPWLAHYGRRGPKQHMWRYNSGSRPVSLKYKDFWDMSTIESTIRTVPFFNGSHYGLQKINTR